MTTVRRTRLKKGTTAENDQWVFQPGYVTIDTTTGYLRIHDGVTPGGHQSRQPVNEPE